MYTDQTTKLYKIPLDHLDYKYIEKCTKVDELEKILKVLRSGEEGKFPDLEDFTEKKIFKLDPNCRILRKDQPAGKTDHLPTKEKHDLLTDLGDWAENMSRAESQLSEHTSLQEEAQLPPVRGAKLQPQPTTSGSNASKKSTRRSVPRDYKEWDKVDIDAELEAVDSEETKPPTKQAPATSSWAGQKARLDVEGMPPEKRAILATREKDKGNEAYKAGEYAEAIHYYTRSLSALEAAPVINNRALAYTKQKKWDKAIEDCSRVLELEPENIKALLRRAAGYKGKQKYRSAATDLRAVLDNEPRNSRAQEMLAEVNEELEKQASHGKRMQIEEVEESESEDSAEEVEMTSKPSGKTSGKRLVIEECSGDEDEISSKDDSWEIVDKEECSQLEAKHSKQNSAVISGCEEGTTVQEVEAAVSEAIEETPQAIQAEGKADQEPRDTQTAALNPPVGPSPDNPPERARSDTPPTEQAIADTPPSAGTPSETPPSAGTPSYHLPIPVVQESPQPQAVLAIKAEGTALFRSGRYGEAAEVYGRALLKLSKEGGTHNSLESSLLCNRASCYKHLGRLADCVADCCRAVTLTPQLPKPWLFRAQASEARERYAEAYVDYRRCLQLSPEVTQALQGSSRCQRQLTEEHGRAWRNKLPELVVERFELRPHQESNAPPQEAPAVPAPSTATSSNESLDFDKCKERGNDLFKKGNYHAAISAYSECLELQADSVPVYTNRALCRLKLGRASEALQDCCAALALDEKNVKALYRRALAHKDIGDFLKAVKDLQAVLKIEANNKAAKTELETVKQLWRKEMEKAKSRDSSSPSAKARTPSPPGQKDVMPGKEKPRKVLIEEVASEEEEDTESKQRTGTSTATGNAASTATSTANSTANSKTSATKDKSLSQKPAVSLDLSTPFSFYKAWNAHKGAADVSGYVSILQQLELKELPKVVGSKLDGDMLSQMLQCVTHFANNDDLERARLLLKQLTLVKRFTTMAMFLTKAERQSMSIVLGALEASRLCVGGELRQLRQVYT